MESIERSENLFAVGGDNKRSLPALHPSAVGDVHTVQRPDDDPSPERGIDPIRTGTLTLNGSRNRKIKQGL